MLELSDIREAADRIRGQVVHTPFTKSRTLSEITGAELYLKFENLQFTSSFKDRGAGNKLMQLTPEERKRGVVAMSAGNHAQGVAYHAQRLGIRAVIVMPQFTPGVKVENTRRFGAEIVLFGDSLEEARTYADKLSAEQGLLLVHPYDDNAIMAGQATIGLEMLEEHPELDVLVIPVGGGGLIAGISAAAKALKPEIEIVGVEVSRFASMYSLLHKSEYHAGKSTIAEGIAVSAPGELCSELIRRHVSDVLLVDEGDVEQAIVLLLEIEKTVVEGAGATGLAAVQRHRERFAGRKVGMVLSGGNIDPMLMLKVIQRGLSAASRYLTVKIMLHDRPGELATISRIIAEADANVTGVDHTRIGGALSMGDVSITIDMETRGRDHSDQVLESLREAGYEATIQH